MPTVLLKRLYDLAIEKSREVDSALELLYMFQRRLDQYDPL